MAAFARVIVCGKNNELPRTYNIPIGVGVDGTVFNYRLTVQPDEILCPVCKGHGEVTYSDINPSVKDTTERCDRCNGNGIIGVEE